MGYSDCAREALPFRCRSSLDLDGVIDLRDTGTWMLGPNTPPKGSIHSNFWTGTAAELANRSHIAVYPTLGWWRTRPKEQRYECRAHYSLVASIATPRVETDIYTPVSQMVGIPAPVEIEV